MVVLGDVEVETEAAVVVLGDVEVVETEEEEDLGVVDVVEIEEEDVEEEEVLVVEAVRRAMDSFYFYTCLELL